MVETEGIYYYTNYKNSQITAVDMHHEEQELLIQKQIQEDDMWLPCEDGIQQLGA